MKDVRIDLTALTRCARHIEAVCERIHHISRPIGVAGGPNGSVPVHDGITIAYDVPRTILLRSSVALEAERQRLDYPGV